MSVKPKGLLGNIKMAHVFYHLVGPPRGFGDLGRMAINFQGAGKHW